MPGGCSDDWSPQGMEPCNFGARCFRKSAEHFESYSHPPSILERRKAEREVKDEEQKRSATPPEPAADVQPAVDASGKDEGSVFGRPAAPVFGGNSILTELARERGERSKAAGGGSKPSRASTCTGGDTRTDPVVLDSDDEDEAQVDTMKTSIGPFSSPPFRRHPVHSLFGSHHSSRRAAPLPASALRRCSPHSWPPYLSIFACITRGTRCVCPLACQPRMHFVPQSRLFPTHGRHLARSDEPSRERQDGGRAGDKRARPAPVYQGAGGANSRVAGSSSAASSSSSGAHAPARPIAPQSRARR